jgi:hypothetical protein
MVHIACPHEKCRRVQHLDEHEYRNFQGKLVCVKCGKEMEVKIEEGKVKSAKKAE